MVLDTMTLEELIREIKTDFSEVKGSMEELTYGNSGKTAQKRNNVPVVVGKRISRHEGFNEWYISF